MDETDVCRGCDVNTDVWIDSSDGVVRLSLWGFSCLKERQWHRMSMLMFAETENRTRAALLLCL